MELSYERPVIYRLGTVLDLTEDHIDKCGGSGDQFLPQILSPEFSENCD